MLPLEIAPLTPAESLVFGTIRPQDYESMVAAYLEEILYDNQDWTIDPCHTPGNLDEAIEDELRCGEFATSSYPFHISAIAYSGNVPNELESARLIGPSAGIKEVVRDVAHATVAADLRVAILDYLKALVASRAEWSTIRGEQ